MAKKPAKKAAQTAAPSAPETESTVPAKDTPPVVSTEAGSAGQEVLGFSPPDQQPLSGGSDTTSAPLTQPAPEAGLIEPLPGSNPAEATNQPSVETTNPPEATPPPPPEGGAGQVDADAMGEGEPPVIQAPAQNLPAGSIIKRAAAYQAPAGKPSSVIRRYFTPMPPDVLAGRKA